MGDFKLYTDVDFDPHTSTYTVKEAISTDVRHEDNRGEYWELEAVWRKTFRYREVDDIDARNLFFAKVKRECAAKLAEFEAAASDDAKSGVFEAYELYTLDDDLPCALVARSGCEVSVYRVVGHDSLHWEFDHGELGATVDDASHLLSVIVRKLSNGFADAYTSELDEADYETVTAPTYRFA
jgi:hypothetical protein